MDAITELLAPTRSVNDNLYDLPVELVACAARHQQHLSNLITSFRAVGLDEETIAGHVHQLVLSYETELLAAVQETLKGQSDA
ncbi:MAG: hypothetical protein JWO15_1869 [Sphingomonadales bacterium]|nr:hypothetical protein [Sphingomonadales bacterium]